VTLLRLLRLAKQEKEEYKNALLLALTDVGASLRNAVFNPSLPRATSTLTSDRLPDTTKQPVPAVGAPTPTATASTQLSRGTAMPPTTVVSTQPSAAIRSTVLSKYANLITKIGGTTKNDKEESDEESGNEKLTTGGLGTSGKFDARGLDVVDEANDADDVLMFDSDHDDNGGGQNQKDRKA